MTGDQLRVAEIDYSAIVDNVRALRERMAPAKVMVVVKANGYGHGATLAARAALEAGADWLGVADVDEALALRRSGINAPLLAWLHDSAPSFDEAVAHSITLGVSSMAQLKAATAAGRVGAPARVHVKVDTGLGRSGAPRETWAEFFSAASTAERDGLVVVEGLFSHLANASDADDLAQADVFMKAIDAAADAGLQPTLRHLAASAAALTLPQTRFDLVRLGISAYGLSPLEGVGSRELGVRPAMTLRSRVIAVKAVAAGTGVSYGYTHRTEAATTLALVGLGYADGVPRHVSNRGTVAIRGRIHPIVGRIAMDQFVVDVGADEVAVGDVVTLFGDPATGAPSADDWAEAAGTINYEIVTRIGDRVQRREVR